MNLWNYLCHMQQQRKYHSFIKLKSKKLSQLTCRTILGNWLIAIANVWEFGCCCCCCSNWSCCTGWSGSCCCIWKLGIWRFIAKPNVFAGIVIKPCWNGAFMVIMDALLANGLLKLCDCCCCCCCCFCRFCCCCWFWIMAVNPDVLAAACKMLLGCNSAVLNIEVVESWLNSVLLAVVLRDAFCSVLSFFGLGWFFHQFFKPCSGGSLFPPTRNSQFQFLGVSLHTEFCHYNK